MYFLVLVMECNKDEAIKAKEIAEKKMQNNDFEGAQKLAAKAQRLYPDLENINQLLAVCNVHCSAKNMLGLEKDWYGILQVDRSADEVTIKKQYRKLALVLHPDKNKFPGAEAAFKLIGEANVVLSDQTKRSIYDSKFRVSIRSTSMRPPPHQVNPPARPTFFTNGFTSQFSGQNQYQKVQSTSSVHETSFWTTCPFCSVRFQYRREIVNRAVRCQNCLKSFVAYDLGYQGVPTGVGLHQPSQPPQQKVVPNQGTTKTAANTAGFPSSHKEFQHGSGVNWAGQEPGTHRGNTSKVFEDLKAKEKHGNGMDSVAGGKGEAGTCKVNEWPQDCRDFKNKSGKRSRKQASESSESFDTSSSNESEDFSNEKGSNPAGGQGDEPNGNFVRRSSRRRQNVSYNEAEEEDDQINHPKIVPDSKPEEKGVPSEQNLHEGNINAPNVDADAAGSTVNGAKKVEVIDCESDSEVSDTSSSPKEFDYPDQEFHDFDKEKEEKCFRAGQLWACYDTVDGMPRYYAHIKKVASSKFRLHFNWLEVDPDDQYGIIWNKAGLPVACGKFKHGDPEVSDNLASFSHQMAWTKGKKKGSYIIYPSKGEIWALFKGWDISWSSEPNKHQPFKYEIVEVLSDFDADVGFKVGYLNKLDGFVSLFQRTSQGDADSSSLLIKQNELYRFSHRIPSFRLTGTEREGVPEGSFELDLASIPQDPNDLWYPLKEANRNGEPELKSPGRNGKTRTPKKVGTPNKSTDCKEVSDGDGEAEMPKLRKSPRAARKR